MTKFINILVIISFIAMIFLPMLTLNTKKDAISEIDNRMLAENPFSDSVRNRDGADLTNDIENYLKDRIGYRDKMILSNTIINDRVFGIMDHPIYAYGKDDYIFFGYSQPEKFGDYHKSFVNMVELAQNYCQARGIPFVFVFEPEKKSVYRDYVADGVNFNNDWIKELFSELDKRNINYVNNLDMLIEKKEAGEQVFNKKYNAGHWNDLGAFYGVNNVLQNMQKFFPNIKLNNKDDFDVDYKVQESLQVSQFPIYDKDPIFTYKGKFENHTSLYSPEVKLDNNYKFFEYAINRDKKQAGSPKALIFQGSYMNGMGYKFFESSLGEYIAVHDYQNILNLPYYINLFQPECVVFEAAEYTFKPMYFDYDKMNSLNWNPTLAEYSKQKEIKEAVALEKSNLNIEKGNKFTKIQWQANEKYEYVWLWNNKEFDMEIVDAEKNLYEVAIPNEIFNNSDATNYIVAGTKEQITPFTLY